MPFGRNATHLARNPTGDAASWREIDENGLDLRRYKEQVGDRDHLKVFANSDVADEWFVVNDPEGVVFEYEVIGVAEDETGSGRQRHR